MKDIVVSLTVCSYEERTKYLETLIQQHKQATMFEEFAGHVFAPVLAPGIV